MIVNNMYNVEKRYLIYLTSSNYCCKKSMKYTFPWLEGSEKITIHISSLLQF